MYTNNFGYMGSRTTGNDAGCYMVTGPGWQGDTPAGIKSVFHSETDFTFTIFRTQLFNADDMPNVEKVQAGYKVQPLSAFLGTLPRHRRRRSTGRRPRRDVRRRFPEVPQLPAAVRAGQRRSRIEKACGNVCEDRDQGGQTV